MKKSFIVLSALCLFLLLVGCSNGASTDEQNGEQNGFVESHLDPCTLITKAEAETALGEPVEDPECTTNSPVGQVICSYSTPETFKFVQIALTRTGDMPDSLTEIGESAATIFETTRDNIEGQNISGLGDQAFWGVPGLHVLKGDIYFCISVGSTDKPENLEMAKGLAELVLSRLP